MEKRICPECGETYNGRVDKKFCSDLCRNNYNNKQNSDATNFVRNITNIMRKNRRILGDLLQGDKLTVSKQKLIDKGFNFKYFTNITITKNNHSYMFCYEFGYLLLDNNMVLIVKKNQE